MTSDQIDELLQLLRYADIFLAFLVGKAFFDIIYNAILRKVGK